MLAVEIPSDTQLATGLILLAIFAFGVFAIGIGLILSVFRTARNTRRTAECCVEIAKATRRTAHAVDRLAAAIRPEGIPPE